MSNSIVSIKQLSHRYTKDWAVKGIDFDINKTGIIGLLGANGAGKSTIMNIMCGVLKQSEGDVIINGIDIRKNPIEARKHIGFLPQKAPLYLDNTIEEYLTHCAYLRKMKPSTIKDAVFSVMEKCGITHFRKRLIKNLSGGYRQRAGIAGAIIHDPKLVVLDEPTVGLDPVQVVGVRKIINDIGKQKAVIFSTHIMSEIQALSSEIKMMNNGLMVFSGSVDEFNGYIEPSTILLTISNPPEVSVIEAVEGVIKAEVIAEDIIRVEFDKSPDVSARLIEKSVKQKWALKEIVVDKSTMEHVFAKITQDLANKTANN